MISPEQLAEDAKIKTGNLDNVNMLANRLIDLQKEIVVLELDLQLAQQHKARIETEELPNEMDACGLKEFTLLDGSSIKVEAVISGSLPSKGAIENADDINRPLLEQKLADGLEFLRDNGADSLIKNVLKFEFDKGKDNAVPELIKIADELGIPHNREQSINHMTLNKFIKERIRNGQPVPVETFSVYNGRKAAVVKPKRKEN